MTKTDIAKKAVSLVIGSGTAKIVGGIIRNNTDPETITDTVTIAAAQVTIGMMVADAASRYTDEKIDELLSWYNANVKKNA